MIGISVIIAGLLNLLLGWQLLRLIRCESIGRGLGLLRVILAYLVGQLFTGMVCYVLLLAQFPFAMFSAMLVVLILLPVLWLVNWKYTADVVAPTLPQLSKTITPARQFTRKCTLIWLAIGLGVLVIFISMFWLSRQAPYGLWDSAAMWNLRVVFLLEANEHWSYIFTNSAIHADYPLLHALSASWLCELTGQWQPVITSWYGFGNALMSLVLMVTMLMRYQRLAGALLAGLLLLATNFWWGMTYWQYADHTLGCYMVASAGVLCLWLNEDKTSRSFTGLLILLAWLTGACAWSKNEGWPWVVSVNLVVLVTLVCMGGRRMVMLGVYWIGEQALVLWMPLSMHLLAESSNDLVSSFSLTSVIGKMFDYHRTQIILSFFGSLYWKVLPPWCCMLGLLWILMDRPWRHFKSNIAGWAVLLLAGLQLTAYLLIFQVTPHDLNWHLGTAANRLLLQVWPIILLGGFMLTCPARFLACPAANALDSQSDVSSDA